MSRKKKKTVSVEAIIKAISNLEELENAGDDHEFHLDEDENGNPQDTQPHTHLEDPTMEGMNDAKPASSGGVIVTPGLGSEQGHIKPKSLQERNRS